MTRYESRDLRIAAQLTGLICPQCEHGGIAREDTRGWLVDHPGRIVPCRVSAANEPRVVSEIELKANRNATLPEGA